MTGHVHCYDPRAEQLARAYHIAANAVKNPHQKPELVSAQLTADIGTAFADLPMNDRKFVFARLNGEGPHKRLADAAITTGTFSLGDDIAKNRDRLGAHIHAMLKALPALDAVLIEEQSRVGGLTP